MEKQENVSQEVALEAIITNAVKLPLVKVNRDAFLAEMFSAGDIPMPEILEKGPVGVGIPREELSAMAQKLILKRTSQSSLASFAAGIPSGLAMAATIPADVLQFFGMALRLAQELSYLYGAQDLWQNGQVDDERVKSQLIMYCGVMFGVSGAVSGVRVLSTQIAKTTLKKLPQKALTKTFWYPIIKQIGKAIGIKVTKTTFAQGVSKAIPIVGGVISGSLNFASMMPMANRLQIALDQANFAYTDEQLNADIEVIENISDQEEKAENAGKSNLDEVKEKVSSGFKAAGAGISGLFARKKESAPQKAVEPKASAPADDVMSSIEKLFELKQRGILTEEEFEKKKADLLARI